MNNGKICVSICAETADELIEQIKRAEDLADLIEIRFDCFAERESNLVLEKIGCTENYIFTFRPKEQGGKRELSLKEREDFWNSGNDFCGGDFRRDNSLETIELILSARHCVGFDGDCRQTKRTNLNRSFRRFRRNRVFDRRAEFRDEYEFFRKQSENRRVIKIAFSNLIL